jgi:hypothetical protein
MYLMKQDKPSAPQLWNQVTSLFFYKKQLENTNTI